MMICGEWYKYLILITKFKHLLNSITEAQEVVINDTYNKYNKTSSVKTNQLIELLQLYQNSEYAVMQESQKYSILFSIWNQLTAWIYFAITVYIVIPCLFAVNVKSGSMVTTRLYDIHSNICL
jgi:hypothetical protein